MLQGDEVCDAPPASTDNGDANFIAAAPTLVTRRKRRQNVRAGYSRGLSRAPRLLAVSFFLLLVGVLVPGPTAALDLGLSEWLGLSAPSIIGDPEFSTSETLSLDDISALRVRDIKRRLSRRHGFGADEIGRMLDKRELINTLSYEEHKLRQKEMDQRKMFLMRRGIMVALVCVILTMFWPLFSHVAEVAQVNFVVYTDKKKYEMGRCWELSSMKGYLGLLAMFIVDLLSFWLTVTVILSWVMRSKYFFPIPNLSIRPAALLAATTGGASGGGPLGRYGINVGSMVVTWALRFVQSRLEGLTGRFLSEANRYQQMRAKEEKRKNETPEERKVRKAARKAEKENKRERARETEKARYEEWNRRHGGTRSESFASKSTGAPGFSESSQQKPGGAPAPNPEALRRAAATAQEYSKDPTSNENDGGWEDSADRSDTFAADNTVDDATKDISEETAFDDID